MPEFISEIITPDPGAFDAGMMSAGLASLPPAFAWRGRRYTIIECLEHVKLTSREGGFARGDRYLRRQRFTVRLDSGPTAVLDFHRHVQSRHGAPGNKRRWVLYTIDYGPGGSEGALGESMACPGRRATGWSRRHLP